MLRVATLAACFCLVLFFQAGCSSRPESSEASDSKSPDSVAHDKPYREVEEPWLYDPRDDVGGMTSGGAYSALWQGSGTVTSISEDSRSIAVYVEESSSEEIPCEEEIVLDCGISWGMVADQAISEGESINFRVLLPPGEVYSALEIWKP